ILKFDLSTFECIDSVEIDDQDGCIIHSVIDKAGNFAYFGLIGEPGKILKMLGAERVVFPEIEIATELADRMTWPNVLDFMPIDPEYSFVEMAVPESLAGRSLREADLRRLYNVWVIGVKDAMTGQLEIFPEPDYRFGADQLLVVVAKQDDLNRLREVK
ncbi:MAG: hypothetical protein JJ992_03775, partial [Planctomycetes bacterium]|nr:hypothetical protein [Planctomycetota bacterium]